VCNEVSSHLCLENTTLTEYAQQQYALSCLDLFCVFPKAPIASSPLFTPIKEQPPSTPHSQPEQDFDMPNSLSSAFAHAVETTPRFLPPSPNIGATHAPLQPAATEATQSAIPEPEPGRFHLVVSDPVWRTYLAACLPASANFGL